MALSPDQLHEFEQVKPHEYEVGEGQTPEQAKRFSVASFQHICKLEGIDVPSDEDVAAEINRRQA